MNVLEKRPFVGLGLWPAEMGLPMMAGNWITLIGYISSDERRRRAIEN